MNIQYIITQALIEFDKKRPVVDKLVKKNNRVKITKGRSDTERDVIRIYNDNDKLLLESEYEMLGSYYPELKIWTWAWANPGMYPPQNYLSTDILNHAIGWGKERSYLKSMLVNSRTMITDPVQLDVNLALSASIIKHYYIYPYQDPIGIRDEKTSLVHYLILLNEEKLDMIVD